MMDSESVLRKFEALNLWRIDGTRAPHKPLLVIYAIGELFRSEDRLLPFSEVDKKLGELLGEYGSWRSRQNTQYPFWRLQNDGIWEVSNADKVRLTASGDAFKRDLIDFDVRGGFTKEVANQLQRDTQLASEIIWKFLEVHFTDRLRKPILESAGIEFTSKGIVRQKRDSIFQTNVLKAYEHSCAVCGFDVRLGQSPVALEVAHIKWQWAGGPDEVVNGLALCSLHHELFDRGAFTLSNDLDILVSKYVYGTSGLQEWLGRFHGKKICLPLGRTYYPSEKFTSWHVNEVFKGDYRGL